MKAVQEALGNDELTADDVLSMVSRWKNYSGRDIREILEHKEYAFNSSGVELADDIDSLRAALAYRKVTPDVKSLVASLEAVLQDIQKLEATGSQRDFLLKASNDIWDAQFHLNKFI